MRHHDYFQKTRSKADSRGFTLLEVLIVIATISLVMGIATLSIASILPGYQLREAARDVFSSFQQVRLEAIKKSSQGVIIFGSDIDGKTYDYVGFIDQNRNFLFDSGDERLMMRQFSDYGQVFWGDDPDNDGVGTGVPGTLASAVDSTVNSDGDFIVVFNNKGMSINPAGMGNMGTVKLQNSKASIRQISVNVAGSVRIQ